MGGACRRCSECVGEEHHWLLPEQFVPFSALEGDSYDGEDSVVLHRCKHCDAVKVWDDSEPDEAEVLHGEPLEDAKKTLRMLVEWRDGRDENERLLRGLRGEDEEVLRAVARGLRADDAEVYEPWLVHARSVLGVVARALGVGK
jgi:hypothetical protein